VVVPPTLKAASLTPLGCVPAPRLASPLKIPEIPSRHDWADVSVALHWRADRPVSEVNDDLAEV